ncbi:Hpt domain-containing protein [Pendulispora albinea]|uniref:histidine kinase n=1 Tax=Pendulispora albinea TaxID=2741071 RepID=A0ABZ2LWK0_9BACT
MSENVDPELTRLLILELRRHLPALEKKPPNLEACRRTLHALKGSAGLAGESELAASLQRLERRVREGEIPAIVEASHLVKRAVERLESGHRFAGSAWPEPPSDLRPQALDPMVRTQYTEEISDRLRAIDAALAFAGDPVDAAMAAYRHVHTMKGAASAVGDEPMSWFCHGLEERLKSATVHERAVAALQELGGFRAVLGALLDDPETALRTLRGMPSKGRISTLPTPRPSQRPEEEPRTFGVDDGTIRVEAQSIDRLLDRFVVIGLARERIAGQVERTRGRAGRLRRMRAELSEALRLIGPPRPWGAPAAALKRVDKAIATLTDMTDEIDRAAYEMRAGDLVLKDSVSDARGELAAMRQMPVGQMFARIASAVEAEARRSRREVVVRIEGAEETIDRRLSEMLLEPCLQIARNSVAHGIEPPQNRTEMGKPSAGTIKLSARKGGSRLTITISDDGQGVDVTAVRKRAVDAGAVAPALADAADDNTLLALLFLPGFSTRETSDLLAGRGIGLDIALGSIQRLRGALRLSSRHGEGFAARVEIPIETGLASVLWIGAGGEEYAVPAANARAVRKNGMENGPRVPHLSACLEARTNDQAPLALEIGLYDDPPYAVGIDSVGRTEKVLVRPLTPLVSTMGPYAGAIVREDGSLRLAIDVYALAPRARALGAVPEAHTSVFPLRDGT